MEDTLRGAIKRQKPTKNRVPYIKGRSRDVQPEGPHMKTRRCTTANVQPTAEIIVKDVN